jgi:hypothetical protein
MEIVIRCHKCGHVRRLKDEQELAYACQMKEWGLLPTTACDSCKEVGGLNLETLGGVNVESDLGDDLVVIKKGVNVESDLGDDLVVIKKDGDMR